MLGKVQVIDIEIGVSLTLKTICPSTAPYTLQEETKPFILKTVLTF